MMPKHNVVKLICKACGVEFERLNGSGRKPLHCSSECRIRWASDQKNLRYREQLRERGKSVPGDVSFCANEACGVEFVMVVSHQKYCSDACRQLYQPHNYCVIGYFNCADCGVLGVKRRVEKLCHECSHKRQLRRDRLKNQRRRAAGEIEFDVFDLARRDGERCNICRRKIDMSLSGAHPMGPTVDHLLPVSMGGTNDASNLALAHRRCNTVRGNRHGAQLLLEA